MNQQQRRCGGGRLERRRRFAGSLIKSIDRSAQQKPDRSSRAPTLPCERRQIARRRKCDRRAHPRRNGRIPSGIVAVGIDRQKLSEPSPRIRARRDDPFGINPQLTRMRSDPADRAACVPTRFGPRPIPRPRQTVIHADQHETSRRHRQKPTRMLALIAADPTSPVERHDHRSFRSRGIIPRRIHVERRRSRSGLSIHNVFTYKYVERKTIRGSIAFGRCRENRRNRDHDPQTRSDRPIQRSMKQSNHHIRHPTRSTRALRNAEPNEFARRGVEGKSSPVDRLVIYLTSLTSVKTSPPADFSAVEAIDSIAKARRVDRRQRPIGTIRAALKIAPFTPTEAISTNVATDRRKPFADGFDQPIGLDLKLLHDTVPQSHKPSRPGAAANLKRIVDPRSPHAIII